MYTEHKVYKFFYELYNIEDPQRKEHEESEFNAAIATLRRLDEVKKFLLIETTKQNTDLFYKLLKAFYKELDPILNKEDRPLEYKKFKDIRKKYKEYNYRKLKKLKVPSIVDDLDDWEIELRRLDQKYGLNLPKKADARYALVSSR